MAPSANEQYEHELRGFEDLSINANTDRDPRTATIKAERRERKAREKAKKEKRAQQARESNRALE